MPLKQLKDYLEKHNVRYSTISHTTVYTAQEIAASAHISGKGLAKTIIVKLDGKMVMVVLPASSKIDFDLLREATGAETVELASELEFKDQFPGCTIGAMPPFGNLYGMDVWVAESLTEDDEIAFNAGSHSELIKLKYIDFEKLVKPKVSRLSAAKVYA